MARAEREAAARAAMATLLLGAVLLLLPSRAFAICDTNQLPTLKPVRRPAHTRAHTHTRTHTPSLPSSQLDA
jgi:hypothetical protein